MHREWVLGGAKPPLELQGQSKLADRLTHLFINKIRDFLGGFAFFNSPSDTRFALFKNFQILGFQVAIFRDGTDVFSNALLLSGKALNIFTGFFQFPVRIDLLPACLGKLCKLFRHSLVTGGRRPAQQNVRFRVSQCVAVTQEQFVYRGDGSFAPASTFVCNR